MSEVELNYKFLDFLTRSINDEVSTYFAKERHPDLNKSIKANFYALDEVGIPIRMKESDKETLFGWKRVGGKFYHHLTDMYLIEKGADAETIRKDTIARLRIQYQSKLMQKNDTMKKILTRLYPDLI